MPDGTPASLLGLLLGGGFLGFLGLLFSARSGRQRDFDRQLDKELVRLRARVDELEDENGKYRAWITKQGVDPETVVNT